MGIGETPAERALQVDAPVVLELEPEKRSKERYRSVIRGWRAGDYVLMDLPKSKELQARMWRGQECVARFLSDGEAYGFASVILDWDDSKAFPHLRTGWPEVVEQVRIRKHERLAVDFPCAAAFPRLETVIDGALEDLSARGCKIVLPGGAAVVAGDVCTLSFDLPDGARIREAQGTVRSVAPGGQHTVLGCEIAEAQPEVEHAITLFVSSTLERMRGGGDRQRALLFDPAGDVSETVASPLRKRGYDLAVEKSPVDLFFRLRLSCPAAVLLGLASEPSPGALCRMIRATSGLEDLPIFAFSPSAPGSGGEDAAAVKQAGATECFTGEDCVKDLVRALTSLARS